MPEDGGLVGAGVGRGLTAAKHLPPVPTNRIYKGPEGGVAGANEAAPGEGEQVAGQVGGGG